MNIRKLVIGLVAVAALSSFAGAMTAPSAKATNNYGLWINPGGSSNALTCGWHSTCLSPYPWGNALDWGNTTNQAVYWRSWATADTGSGTVGYAFPYNATSEDCYGAGAHVYDLGWTHRGSVVWLHTALSGSAPTVYIDGSWSGAYTSSGSMGTTVGEELEPTCPWTDPHLHQYSTASGWFANTNVYPGAPSTGTGYALGNIANWQNRTSWVW